MIDINQEFKNKRFYMKMKIKSRNKERFRAIDLIDFNGNKILDCYKVDDFNKYDYVVNKLINYVYNLDGCNISFIGYNANDIQRILNETIDHRIIVKQISKGFYLFEFNYNE